MDPVPRTASPYIDPNIKGPTSQIQAEGTDLRKMISSNVNKTALHPGGVTPYLEHTELEQELHDKAHIDYDRVAIIPNPSVAALYEDALVYETGSAITSSGALTAYSGAKTGRSPLDKRIVKEPSSEDNIWWGPVNKPMTPERWEAHIRKHPLSRIGSRGAGVMAHPRCLFCYPIARALVGADRECRSVPRYWIPMVDASRGSRGLVWSPLGTAGAPGLPLVVPEGLAWSLFPWSRCALCAVVPRSLRDLRVPLASCGNRDPAEFPKFPSAAPHPAGRYLDARWPRPGLKCCPSTFQNAATLQVPAAAATELELPWPLLPPISTISPSVALPPSRLHPIQAATFTENLTEDTRAEQHADKITQQVWKINRERAVDYLNTRNRIYVVDGFAGWDEKYRIRVRVICARAYHALFMRNMLIRPSRAELEHFHPDYTIYNAGSFPANRYTEGMTSGTSVAINFDQKEMVILGTEYAGEMKKGVFTVLFYEMPIKHNVLTLHSSANEGKNGDVTLFFGLSGTGKTTLSADPNRALIGDDEHCWSDTGVFNIEGGCYAKTVGLSAEKEPDIHGAIRFGSVLENVVFDPETREVDYDDVTLTENTRCAYPIEYINNAKIPCLSENAPSNIILLTCDARGVLPPISKLDGPQTMFHFISGYTSKMAGTEEGVTEPQATFSSCFAQPFLALHPMKYAKMLADKIEKHKANAWLLNTGWAGAGFAQGGKRCPLKYTRAILDAIHSGELANVEYETYEVFNLQVPTSVPGVPSELLNPKKAWTAGDDSFTTEVVKLGKLFRENFAKYEDEATEDVVKAGPIVQLDEVVCSVLMQRGNITVPEYVEAPFTVVHVNARTCTVEYFTRGDQREPIATPPCGAAPLLGQLCHLAGVLGGKEGRRETNVRLPVPILMINVTVREGETWELSTINKEQGKQPMKRHDSASAKPGARFAFKPTRSTISSSEEPEFLYSQPKTQPNNSKPQSPRKQHKPLQDLGTMVNERAPPKAPLPLHSTAHDDDSLKREKSPESDFDFSTLAGFGSLKPEARGVKRDPFHPSGATNAPTFGHPTKMISSRKQRADVFVHQKSRPEHHIDSTRVAGPLAPVYKDKKPPPMQMFSSEASIPIGRPPAGFGEDVFYTDPSKASADLKALLEGGMESDDEEANEAAGQAKVEGAKDPKDGSVEGLKVRLLPHQVEGVEWMRGRELGPVKRGRVPRGGILADDMGLGKTLQTISLILTNRKPEKDAPGWKKAFEKVEKTTLVVAPLALIRQWEHEIKDRVEKSQGIKVCVHHGPQRTKRFKDLALYDVVITTYQILVSEHGHSSDAEDGVKAGAFGLHWWRVVLDEAHTIKNRNAKATKACYALRSEYRWCLSGTPMQNNLDELQSLIKFLRIRPYDDLKEWKAHIDQPLKNGKGHIAIRRLHSLLRCFMKRRTKAILKEAGALNPGGKPSAEGEESTTGFKVTERKVVTVATQLSPAERKFYDRLEARTDKSIEVMMRGKVNYANALTLLLRLRQACNHPKLVEGKLEKDKDALSTDSSQKPQEADIDSMADMFAGMGIVTKTCNICGRDLGSQDNKLGRDMCTECYDDLAYFNNHENAQRKKPKKKAKVKKVVKEMVKVEPKVESKNTAIRRPRNRNAVIDSDDDEDEEEAEGSWLVPEGEQSRLRLGKAGGEEDENAEGGGDWIGQEDSDDDEEGKDQDQSNLSSFIVDDEVAKREKGYMSPGHALDSDDSDDDSLLSVSALTKQLASQTLRDSDADADSTVISVSGSDSGSSDSGIDASELLSDDDNTSARKPAQTTQILASAKIRELIKILHTEIQDHKFIVFSQFTSMLDLVEPFFRKEGFRFVRYDGSMKNDAREESLRRLREDDGTRVLLCSLKCGSLGLNLTAATRVVILEPFWNPFVEEQAIDRVHRLTQTIDVIIYKLTVSHTVEERILDLQDKKRTLAEQAIEGSMKKGAFKLGINEMIELFKPTHHDGGSAALLGHDDEHEEESLDDRGRRAAGMLGRKPGLAKQESEVYGRRW
ncbi:hypothetical protein G7046_g5078 [Stylonectria norvegica]|nr:hypothetical protein G7046_g5078 [Stylonectria norvegica]